MKTKIKSSFIINTDLESILVPEDNGKQNPEESYTSKYQKHVACSYGYILVCDDDKISESFKSNLGGYSVYNFINNMVEKNKYCKEEMKKCFNKKFVITKEEDDEDFENSTKCWIYNAYVDGDVKARGWHETLSYN